MIKHKAKKSLGQNFLKSQDALRKIISTGELSGSDTVLEIGPGLGALTEKILIQGCKLFAVEKDDGLLKVLEEKFKNEIENKKLTIISGDILEFDEKNLPRGYKIIANIPYNITGAIIKKFLTSKNQPERMVLMVQKEVAERIIARDGKESLLSISVKAYGEPKMITKVPARYFSPAPKVDSAVILIKNIKNSFKNSDEERFWQVLRAGFAHKRKVLLKNLKNFDKNTDWETIFMKIGLKKEVRAEELSVLEWYKLTS